MIVLGDGRGVSLVADAGTWELLRALATSEKLKLLVMRMETPLLKNPLGLVTMNVEDLAKVIACTQLSKLHLDGPATKESCCDMEGAFKKEMGLLDGGFTYEGAMGEFEFYEGRIVGGD